MHGGKYELSIDTFSDASKFEDRGQIGLVCWLMIEKFGNGSVYHPSMWSSKRAKRPVKSVATAEVLAATVASD